MFIIQLVECCKHIMIHRFSVYSVYFLTSTGFLSIFSSLNNAILILCLLLCALHAEKFEKFLLSRLQNGSPYCFFRGSLLRKTFKHISNLWLLLVSVPFCLLKSLKLISLFHFTFNTLYYKQACEICTHLSALQTNIKFYFCSALSIQWNTAVF